MLGYGEDKGIIPRVCEVFLSILMFDEFKTSSSNRLPLKGTLRCDEEVRRPKLVLQSRSQLYGDLQRVSERLIGP